MVVLVMEDLVTAVQDMAVPTTEVQVTKAQAMVARGMKAQDMEVPATATATASHRALIITVQEVVVEAAHREVYLPAQSPLVHLVMDLAALVALQEVFLFLLLVAVYRHHRFLRDYLVMDQAVHLHQSVRSAQFPLPVALLHLVTVLDVHRHQLGQ